MQMERGCAGDEGAVVQMCFVDGRTGALYDTTAARKSYTGDRVSSSTVSMKLKNSEAICWRP